MAETSNRSTSQETGMDSEETEEYVAPEIDEKGTLNELTQGGSQSGTLDASYSVGTSSSYGGGLFS